MITMKILPSVLILLAALGFGALGAALRGARRRVDAASA